MHGKDSTTGTDRIETHRRRRTGDNDAYVDHDFATKTSGASFDCAAPKNTSPHNTGLTGLPPAQAARIPYDGGSVPEFGKGSTGSGALFDVDDFTLTTG